MHLPILALLSAPAFLAAPLMAAEFAVIPAPQGSDSGTGTAERPYATIAKALTRAGQGDTIWLVRGGVYRESGLKFPAGVQVKATGPADQAAPLITPSVVVATAWKPWDRNPKVLTATVDLPVRELYVNGRFQPLARWPNLDQGWMRTKAGTTPDRIVDPERAKAPGAAANRWKGAQVRWRRWSWWWETRPITADDGIGSLSLGAEGRFQDPFTGEGSAWWVDNCLAELDAPGEWYHDAAAKTLYLFPPAGSDAKKMVVEVSPEAPDCEMNGGTLEGIGFARHPGQALSVTGACRIQDCLFQDIGTDALSLSFHASGTQVTGCTFRDVRNVAIRVNEDPKGAGGIVIERNRLERIGMQFGHGGSGSWHAAGIILQNGKAVQVRLNRIIDTGYAGIILGCDGQVVERNIFVRCMGSLNDGAAIYANCSRSVIRENIILDTVGNLETSHFWYPLGHGIWPEFLSDFREQVIVGNTVFGSGGNGLFLTNNYKCEVRENVLIGNRRAGLLLEGRKDRRGAQDHVIADNVLAVVEAARRVAQKLEQIPANWKGNDVACGIDFDPGIAYGKMTGTVFVVPPGSPLMMGDKRRYEKPEEWKDLAWADPAPRQARMAALLLINDTEQEADMPAPAGWLGLDGKPAGKAVRIKPFRSAVLVRAGDGSSLPPYQLASGTDYRGSGITPKAPSAAEAKAEAAAAAKAEAKAKREEAAAQTQAASAQWMKAKPDAAKRFGDRLHQALSARIAKRGDARFTYQALRAPVTIVGEEAGEFVLLTGDGARMTADLFRKLAPSDALGMAQDLARAGDPQLHAIAAFFARLQGDAAAYGVHLAQAGSAAGEVESAFE